MDSKQVDPATIGVWRWHYVIVTVVLAVGAGAALLPLPQVPALGIAMITVLLGILFSWLWPTLYYRHLHYRVDATGIDIQRGVLWRSHIALPRVRIQHTDVSQGPLQRHYGVGTLRLYTAGSRHTMIELPGLAHADAIALREALLAESHTSGV